MWKNFCQVLQSICLTNPNIPIWIAGDLITKCGLGSLCVVNNAYPIDICETFMKFVLNHGFTQMVQFPTRGENILDIFLANRPYLVNHCDTVLLLESVIMKPSLFNHQS